jgi:hypothetical protein
MPVPALPFYPRNLPCASRIEGHAAVLSAGLIRTPMTAGNTRQRRAQRQLPHQISLAFVVSQALLADWLTWVNAYAFDAWFSMRLPGLLASQAGADTAPVPVRFMSDIQLELIPAARLWYWRARVDCEYLPTLADLALEPVWITATRPGEIDETLPWIVAGRPDAPAPDWILAGDATAPASRSAGTADSAQTLKELLS